MSTDRFCVRFATGQALMEQFEQRQDGLLVRAPAKVNLSLLVAGRRDDGFHEIETIMAKVDLFDELLIRPGQRGRIELDCAGPYAVACGRDNLVYRACELVLEKAGVPAGVSLTLTKKVPGGAGLGSASSDAAAALLGLNRFLELGLGEAELHELACRLGSDVPFFLGGPLAICTGRGEKIEKLRGDFRFRALLLLPDVSVCTAEVYANYRHNRHLYRRLKGQIKRYLQENRIDLIVQICANMLEASCFELHRELAELKLRVEALGIRPVCLSGSGSALFWAACDNDKRRILNNKLKVDDTIGCKNAIVSINRW